MKVNQKMLRKASEIAHGYCWVSDCPTFLREVNEYLVTRNCPKYRDYPSRLAWLVSVIHHVDNIR